MLATFPPPGHATRDNTPRPHSVWPMVDPAGRDHDPSKPKRKRRCCGLPCWGFCLVLLILLIIIAAAVVVPLELLIFHKAKNTSRSSVTALQSCSENSATACQNSGTSALSSGSCSCICINGFTGSTCSVAGDSGCTTMAISTEPEYTNVTLGNSIPRLVEAAQANFSIPLFTPVILARFNSANLSCISENALVTFDGHSQRVGAADEIVRPPTTSDSTGASPTSSSNKLRRKASSSSSSEAPAATANGVLYDPASGSNSSGTSSSAASAATAAFSVTEEVLDFARVAVLFVLQQETLDSAEAAQASLQHFFTLSSSTNQAAQNLSLGNGNTVDLLDLSIDLGNGSVGVANANVTKKSVTVRRSINLWSVFA